MRTDKRERKNYTMTLSEMEELIQTVEKSPDPKTALHNSQQVWKKLGNKYGFHWETAGKPTFTVTNPLTFSAIPKRLEEYDA